MVRGRPEEVGVASLLGAELRQLVVEARELKVPPFGHLAVTDAALPGHSNANLGLETALGRVAWFL